MRSIPSFILALSPEASKPASALCRVLNAPSRASTIATDWSIFATNLGIAGRDVSWSIMKKEAR